MQARKSVWRREWGASSLPIWGGARGGGPASTLFPARGQGSEPRRDHRLTSEHLQRPQLPLSKRERKQRPKSPKASLITEARIINSRGRTGRRKERVADGERTLIQSAHERPYRNTSRITPTLVRPTATLSSFECSSHLWGERRKKHSYPVCPQPSEPEGLGELEPSGAAFFWLDVS